MLNSKARIVEVSPRAANGKNPNQAMNEPESCYAEYLLPRPNSLPRDKHTANTSKVNPP